MVERRSSRLRTAERFLAVASALVPGSARAEWLREWRTEVWYDIERGVSGRHLAARLVGALPHALWLRGASLRAGVPSARDVRHGLRGMRRQPGFAALVIGTMGVGIGVTVAMFTIVNGVVIRSLPYPDADALVFMYGAFANSESAAISPPDFLDYREQNRTFEQLAAHTFVNNAVLTSGEAERVRTVAVTANLLATLGLVPVHGRGFLPEEETGPQTVAILSQGLWRRRFGADPGVVGQDIRIDGRELRVVGVLPPLAERTLEADVWLPMAFGTPSMTVRRFHFMRAIGRLRAGVELAPAQADMDRIAADLERTHPENATWHLRLVPYQEAVVGPAGRTLVLLMGAVTFVLLIACANVANLLLARATARTPEVAIRKALGASRGRLLRQFLTESVLLAVGGAVVGVGIAVALIRLVRATAAGIVPRLLEIQVDTTVLAFALALAGATGIGFGLLPALRAGRAGAEGVFSMRRTTAGRAGRRLRNTLVIVQIALSVMLLAGAGLMLRSLQRMQQVEPGFATAGLMTARVTTPPRAGMERAPDGSFAEALLEGIRALPGVEGATATTMLPLRGGGDTYYWLEREPPASPEDRRNAQINVVADDYFATLGIPILAGVDASGARESDPNVVVISRSLAETVFPDGDALGERLVVDFGEPFTVEIAGIAGDVRAFGVVRDAPDIMYFPHRQGGGFGRGPFDVVVRASGDALAVTPAVRSVLRALDPDVPLSDVTTMGEALRSSMGAERFVAGLFAGFAGLALATAAVGLYGVLAYVVARRTREIGIRVALGAARRQVFGTVLGEGMVLIAAGIVLGLALALATGRLLRGLLFETGTAEPLVLLAVVSTLALAGLVACAVPALRATRTDPSAMLRPE